MALITLSLCTSTVVVCNLEEFSVSKVGYPNWALLGSKDGFTQEVQVRCTQ